MPNPVIILYGVVISSSNPYASNPEMVELRERAQGKLFVDTVFNSESLGLDTYMGERITASYSDTGVMSIPSEELARVMEKGSELTSLLEEIGVTPKLLGGHSQPEFGIHFLPPTPESTI